MPNKPTPGKGEQQIPKQNTAEEHDSTPTKEIQAPSKIHLWVDTVNKSIQILAVVIAGIWTWIIYARTNAPGLVPKLNLRSELSWADTADKDVCMAAFHVWAKNESQGAFEIDTIKVTAQLLDLTKAPKPSDSEDPFPLDLKFADVNGKNLNVGDSDILRRDLLAHYSPGTEYNSESTFLFRWLPNRLIVFRAVLSGQELGDFLMFAASQKISEDTWSSAQLCGQKVRNTK
jgi:hypothetical protein